MKSIIILLTLLFTSTVHAGEITFFSNIPSFVTTNAAIASVKQAALKRQWTAHELENKKLRINLNHRGYKAILIFSFSENEIKYSDHTTYFNDVFADDDEAEGAWEPSLAPQSWVTNLKNDTNNYFLINAKRTPVKNSLTDEDVENKLISLKALYEKKLITDEEYELKKKKIMSEF